MDSCVLVISTERPDDRRSAHSTQRLVATYRFQSENEEKFVGWERRAQGDCGWTMKTSVLSFYFCCFFGLKFLVFFVFFFLSKNQTCKSICIVQTPQKDVLPLSLGFFFNLELYTKRVVSVEQVSEL